jgi:uncharacterized protein YidB (DUF937 family)
VAKLYFRYGAMNSGKSTALLQAAYNYEERGQRVLLAKPLIDTKGADQIESLSAQSGLSRDELLSGLSQYLPQVVDHLTPDGRLPTEQEIAGRV